MLSGILYRMCEPFVARFDNFGKSRSLNGAAQAQERYHLGPLDLYL